MSPKSQARRLPIWHLLIQYICSLPPYWRPFLHSQPEDAPCCGDRDSRSMELARYKLVLVGVQEVRWDKGCIERAGDYIFLYGKGNKNHQLELGFLYTTE